MGRAVAGAVGGGRPTPAPAVGEAPRGPHIGASDAALADIPPGYLARYVTAAGTCPALAGRSWRPSTRSSPTRPLLGPRRARRHQPHRLLRRPMQFNLTNGPPSTWDTWGTSVPRPRLRPGPRRAAPPPTGYYGDGLARPEAVGRDPCPQVLGSAAHSTPALRRYNNACWYVHEVVTLAGRFTRAAPPRPRPATRSSALVANPGSRPRPATAATPGPTWPPATSTYGSSPCWPSWPSATRSASSCLRSGHSASSRAPPGLQPHRLASRGHRHGRRPRRQPPPSPPHPRPLA